MIKNYLIISWRNLVKYKILSVINILGLSLGLTCAILSMLFIEHELSYDQQSKGEKVYRVVEKVKFLDQVFNWSVTAYPLAAALREDFSDFEMVTQAAGPMPETVSISYNNKKKSIFNEDRVIYVDPYFLEVFDHHWLAGDPNTALDNNSSVVLTSSIARKYFGELTPSQVLGHEITLNAKDPLLVTGIIADPPTNSSLLFSMLCSFELYKSNEPYRANNWSGNYEGTAYVVLPEETSVPNVEKRINQWKSKYLNEDDNLRKSYSLQPLSDIHTNEAYQSSPGSFVMPKRYLIGAGTIGILILVIACINYINLATANATRRAKEVGIRKTLGGTRKQLVYQFLLENCLISFVSVLLSLTLTQLISGKINSTFEFFNLELTINHIMLVMVFGLLTAIISGMYPSMMMSSFKPHSLQKQLKTTKWAVILRRSLVIFQFTAVQIMIICTLVVTSQMEFINNKNLGFQKDAILTLDIPDLSNVETFQQEIMGIPTVNDITFSSGPPTSVHRMFGTNFRLPHQTEKDGMSAEMKGVDPNYLNFYRLELIAGRNFRKAGFEFDEFIVNEALLSALGWSKEEAIGKRIAINEGEAIIVGVVKDFHNNSLQHEITPCILVNWDRFFDVASIRYTEGVLGQQLPQIKETWSSLFPEGAFEYQILEDFLSDNYRQEENILAGFKSFSIVAIIIGCLGLFGLVQFISVQRTKEIGIRKVLGASPLSLVALLSSEFYRLVLLAFIIACPVGYMLMNEWLNGFMYRIEIPWFLFLVAGMGAFAITSLTIGYQTGKTIGANPVNSLRYE